MGQIQKIKIVLSKIEEALNGIDPHWKEKDLYRWQWDRAEREEYNHTKILDLKGFSERNIAQGYKIYQKGTGFVFVKGDHSLIDVLTNIEPKTDDRFIYSPNDKTREIALCSLFDIEDHRK